MIETRILVLAGHVAGMGKTADAYRMTVRKPGCIWAYNIKMDFKKIRL
jgi:hypothetical protein